MRESAQDQILSQARQIEPMIRSGETMPFYEAFDRSAVSLAASMQITETGAKALMKEAYEVAEGRDLYATCKEAEREAHLPRREAERKAREQETADRPARSRVRGMEQ